MITGKSEEKNKTAYFFLGLIVVSIFQVIAFAQPGMGQCIEPAQQNKSISVIETIISDNSQHHLGIDFKEDLTPKEPEGIIYTKTFVLDSEFESPELVFIANSVSPYEINATEYIDRIHINDVEVALLNCYFKQPPEAPGPAEVDISFDQGLLRIGTNTIKITSGSNNNGTDHDDFEFYLLTLKGVRKTGWVLSGKVLVDDEPAFLKKVDVYRHGTEELVSSFRAQTPNGSYSMILANGKYDVKVEAWSEISSPAYNTKTIVINNSNVTLDFKAPDSITIRPPIPLFYPPFIVLILIFGFIITISVYVFTKKRKTSIEKSHKVEDKNDSKLFKMCILYGMAGFGLIGILPYEIPLFLRVSIACILLGIPLLDPRKIIILGISGGAGYLAKDYIFWDLTDLKWWTFFNSRPVVESILSISLAGAIIGAFLGIALWNKKAVRIFPLCSAIAFLFGTVVSLLAPFLGVLLFGLLNALSIPLWLIDYLQFLNPYTVSLFLSCLGGGAVLGAGMYLYLSSLINIRTIFRAKVISFFSVIIAVNVFFILFTWGISGGHPPNFVTSAPIGEAVERYEPGYEPYTQCTIIVNNHTFMPQDTGNGLNLNVGVTIKYCSGSPDIFLVYKQDEYPWGSGIVTKYSSWNDPAWKQPEDVRNAKIEPDAIYYRNYTFENVPSRLRTKDYAVVWLWMNRTEFGESGAFEHIIMQLK